MDKLCEPCELLKVPTAIRTLLPTKPPNCLHLIILEAELHLLVLSNGLYLMKTVTKFNNSVIVVTKMITSNLVLWCSAKNA